ncbi:hypothetical protein OEZ86_011967 [Tetradesmus obliquus]|nr:hypothetical protein OEZ86_011967 [Tetradesmus obliquus]
MTGMSVRLLLLAAAALAVCQADSLGGRKLQQGFGDPGQQTCPIQYCKEASACVYSSRTKAWQCKACNFPRIPNTRQTECVCPAGMYPMANGGCAPCKMNQFCPLGQSATTTTAKNCPPNTVTLKTGARSVNDCFNKPGYRYFRTSSGVRAIACGDDEYTVGLKKQTTCTRCMPGFKTDPANPPGIHTSSAVCVAPPGSFVAGDSVVPCPKGEYSDSYDSSTSCTTCLDEFGEGITTEKANSTSRSDCKWLERGYALVDDRKKVVTTTLASLLALNRQWLGAKPCPQNSYCPGGNPDAGGQPLVCPGTGNNQLWTEGEGAIAVDECVAPPGFVYDSGGNQATPCSQGQYKEGWNRLTTCDYCSGTSNTAVLAAVDDDLWLSDPTTFINKLDPSTGITMQQFAVRGSPENCYIQRGMGVMSMRDIKTGTTYFKAVVCPADSYGINGPNPATGVFKKYGRTITPCTACPTNMQTGQYATPEDNAASQITSYLTKVTPTPLTTQTTTYSGTGGYFSVDACATQDGYGYYSGSSQICPAGTYNGKGNKNPCTQCPFGTTTNSGVAINVDIGFCSVYIQGYGLVNGATAMCAVGTWQGVNKPKDSDGKACTTCPVGYVTGDVGSIRAANCSLCAAGYGDFDPLTGDKAAHTDLAGLTCQFCPAGYYGPAARTSTPCLSCPTGRTYTYSWDGTDDVFSPLATSPVGSKDINDCVADMAQTVDGAFELPLVLSHRAVTKLPDADNLKTCAQRCRDNATCAAVTFDYLEVACYMWQPVTDKPFNLAGGVAVKVFPSQNLALSTKVTGKAMGNGQYTFWMDGDELAGVPAALDSTGVDQSGNKYYADAVSASTLQNCLDFCTNSNLCVGARFGAYDLTTGTIDNNSPYSCRLIMAKVQPGNSRRSLIKADFNSFTQSLVVPPGYYTDPGSNTIQLCNDDVEDITNTANAVSYYCLGGLVGVANRTVCPAAVSVGVYTPPDAAKGADCWSLLKPGYQSVAAREAKGCDADYFCPGSVVGGYTFTGVGAGRERCPTGTKTTTATDDTDARDSTACIDLQPGYYYTGETGAAPVQITTSNVLLCPKGSFCLGTVNIDTGSLSTAVGNTTCPIGTTTPGTGVTLATDCTVLLPGYHHNGDDLTVTTTTVRACPANGFCPGGPGPYTATAPAGVIACPGYACAKSGTAGNNAVCDPDNSLRGTTTLTGGAGTTTAGTTAVSAASCNKLDVGFYYKPTVASSRPDVTTVKPCEEGDWCAGTDISGVQITVFSAVTGITGTCPKPGSTSVAGSNEAEDCTLVKGYYYTGSSPPDLTASTIQPCKPGNGLNRLTTCDNCAGTSISNLLTGDLWLSDPTTFINKLDPNTGITMQQVAVRGSPENCYIQRGMGVVSMRDIKTGTTYLKAVVCTADSYGINGPDPATGVFKKYGRTITPCTACPTNMKTGQYATPEANAENKITGYLEKTNPVGLETQSATNSGAGGYFSVDACATQDGYGYYSGSSQICPAGTYNGRGNKNPCTHGVTINVDAGYCSKYIQGYGLVNGATAMCAVGTYQTLGVTKDVDGEACSTCMVGYTSGDLGSISPKNCSLCAAGYGDFDPLSGDTASNPNVPFLTCQLCPSGYYGPASRTSTPCLSCPTGRTYTYSWDGTDDVFSPLATSPVGAKDINDCVADMAQTVDGAFELPLDLSKPAVTKLDDADNLKSCAQACRNQPDCAAVTFDYMEVACYMWKPVTDAPFKAAGGVAVKVFPSQNLALSLKSKAMGNGQYTFWMDGSATGVPAAIDKTGNTYYTNPAAPLLAAEDKLQACLDACTNSNLCVGAAFGAYDLTDDSITSDSCRLIMAKVQPGNSRRSLIKADFNSFTQSLTVPPGYYTDPGSNTIKLCNDDVDVASAGPVSYYCEGGLIGAAPRKTCTAAAGTATVGVYTPPDAAAATDCWSLLMPGYYFSATNTAAECAVNTYCPGSVVGGYKSNGGSRTCPAGTAGLGTTAAVNALSCKLIAGYYYTGVAGAPPHQLDTTNVLVCTKGYFCPGGATVVANTNVQGRTACQTGTTTEAASTASAIGTLTADAALVATVNNEAADCNILLPGYFHNGLSTAVDGSTIKTCLANAYCPGSCPGGTCTTETYTTALSGVRDCPGYDCTAATATPVAAAACAAQTTTPNGGSGTSSAGQSAPTGCDRLDPGWFYLPGALATQKEPIEGTTIKPCEPDNWCAGTKITLFSTTTGISGTCPTLGSTSVAGSKTAEDCTVEEGYYYTGIGSVLNDNTIQPCKPGYFCPGVAAGAFDIDGDEQGASPCTVAGTTCTGITCKRLSDCQPPV